MHFPLWMHLVTPGTRALRLAVSAVLVGEAVVFAGLTAAHGVPQHVPSLTAIVLAATVGALLVGAAAALGSALRALRANNADAAVIRLLVAGAVGLVALAFEIVGGRVAAAGAPISLVVAGLHAAHIAGGIALATWLAALLHGRRVHRHHVEVSSLVTTYGYFVAGVWMVVWPLVMSPRA